MDEVTGMGKPAFLAKETAEAASYNGVPPDAVPTFDEELSELKEDEIPSAGYITRHREIARLHALGLTNNAICEKLGYSPARMSIVLRTPFVQEEIAKWRALLQDEDTLSILKETARDGARRLRATVLDPNAKDSIVLDATKFAIEKSHGKAKQEVSVESGSLQAFTELLRSMQKNGEMIDVTPPTSETTVKEIVATQESDKFQDWLKSNLSPA